MIEADLPLHRQRPSWATLIAPALVLTLLTLAVYLPAIHGPLVFDDTALVRTPDGLIPKLAADPWQILHAHRPLSDLTFMINHWLTGDSLAGFHLTNVLLHIAAGLVLLDLVRRTLCSPIFNLRWITLATPLATIIAGLWLLHPIQTQAVAYISQRSEIMAMLFAFISLDAIAMAAGGGRMSRAVKTIAILACIAAMLCKQTGFIVPIAMLFYDRCFWSNSFKNTLKTQPLFYTALALTLIVPWIMGLGTLFVSSPQGNAASHVSVGAGTRGYGVLEYFFSQQSIIVHYITLIFWPATLVLDSRQHLMEPAVLSACPAVAHPLSLCITVTLGVLTLWALWRKPAAGFCGLWFFITLGPTSSFVPLADLIMEHRMYGPSAAVIALCTITLAAFLASLTHKRILTPAAAKWIARSLILTVTIALCVRTSLRTTQYAAAVTIWQATHDARPTNTRAMLALGKQLEQHQPEKALSLYQKAALTEPENYEPMIALGTFHLLNDNPAEAKKWYTRAWIINGDRQTYLLNMGLVSEALDDLPAAATYLAEASLRSPDDVRLLVNLGMVQDKRATRALLQSDFATSSSLRDDAIATLRHALEIDPASANAKTNLATALANRGMSLVLQGHARPAVESLKESLTVQPRSETARRLAWLWATWPEPLIDDMNLSVQLAHQAATQAPPQARPLYLDTLAAALARAGDFRQAVDIQHQAIEMAKQAAADQPLLDRWTDRLNRYRKQQPHIEKPEPASLGGSGEKAN